VSIREADPDDEIDVSIQTAIHLPPLQHLRAGISDTASISSTNVLSQIEAGDAAALRQTIERGERFYKKMAYGLLGAISLALLLILIFELVYTGITDPGQFSKIRWE
jgi:hypothetical protein